MLSHLIWIKFFGYVRPIPLKRLASNLGPSLDLTAENPFPLL